MPSPDGPQSLRADIARRWKEELFSPDTGVAVVSVAVALPAGAAAAWLFEPILAYPVLFVVAVAPNLSDFPNGVRDLTRSETVGLAVALALGHLTLVLALFFGAAVAGATAEVAVVIAVVGTFLIGNATYRRLLRDRLVSE